MCGRLQSLGDSQVGSTGLCAPETPIRKTVCVREGSTGGQRPLCEAFHDTGGTHAGTHLSCQDALHPRLQQVIRCEGI